MNFPSWLPSPLFYAPFIGDEQGYIETAYNIFQTDFIHTKSKFQGKPLIINADITYKNKEETFWHLISEKSGTTGQRIPNFERCERLPWIRSILDNADIRSDILIWENQRYNPKNKRRTVHTPVLFNDSQFPHLVVLAEQKPVVVLLSSYPIKPNSHKHQSLIQEYNSCRKQTAAT